MQHPRITSDAGRRPIALLRPALSAFVLMSLVALIGPARAQPLPPDPVEQFKAALKLEQAPDYSSDLKGDELKAVIAFREKNLKEKARQLKTVRDLSRALLLVEWRTESLKDRIRTGDFGRDARIVEQDVRDLLVDSFVQKARAIIKKGDGKSERDVALANLIAETVSTAATLSATTTSTADRGLGYERLHLYDKLAPLARDLAKLVEADKPLPSPRVRAAISRALGQFPTEPNAVLPTLARFLAKDNPESVRRAAANALVTLVLVVAGRDLPRGSEPGVTFKESPPSNQYFDDKQKLAVAALVVPVAGKSLQDRSPEVRKAAINALYQVATTLAGDIPRPLIGGATDSPYPPRERTEWSKREREKVFQGRETVVRFKAELEPVAAAFVRQSSSLVRALSDRDPEVRLRARRTIEEVGRMRRLLREYANSVPPDPSGPPPAPRKGPPQIPPRRSDVRAPAAELELPALPRPRRTKRDSAIRPVVHRDPPEEAPTVLPVPPLPARAVPRLVRQDKKAGKGAKEKKAPAKPERFVDSVLTRSIEAELKYLKLIGTSARTSAELDKLLAAAAARTVRAGLTDKNVKARRAALDAIEAMGDLGKLYIPDLVKALKDRDVFVRWIAARALGKLAPVEPDTVVPGLAALLPDLDLDLRIIVATALGYYGPAAAPAVPALTKAVGNGDAEARVAALKALEQIGLAAKSSLPAIAAALKNGDPRVRTEAARVLGRFGRLARGTLPALRPLARDPDAEVRKTASEAILQILGD